MTDIKPKKGGAWKVFLLLILFSFCTSFFLDSFKLSNNQLIWLQQTGDILFATFMVIYYRRIYPNMIELLKLNAKKLVFGLATSLSVVLLTDELLIYLVSGEFKKAAIQITPKWVTLLATGGILAPITEEVIFRGILLKLLLSSYKTCTAVLLNGMMFGILHITPIYGFGMWSCLVSFAHAFCFAILLSIITHKTKNLSFAFGYHIANNILVFLVG